MKNMIGRGQQHRHHPGHQIFQLASRIRLCGHQGILADPVRDVLPQGANIRRTQLSGRTSSDHEHLGVLGISMAKIVEEDSANEVLEAAMVASL